MVSTRCFLHAIIFATAPFFLQHVGAQKPGGGGGKPGGSGGKPPAGGGGKPPAGGGGKPPAGGGEPPGGGGGEGQPPAGGGGGPGGGGGVGSPASSSSHAAPMLGNVGVTTVSGTGEDGTYFASGEDIFGPFEAGFASQQDFILEGLGCSQGSLGHVDGGIDTYTAEQMVAHQCGITLPRFDGKKYVSLLDQCGGHTHDYHFHERLSCLYDGASGAHSTKVAEMGDGKPLYGKWENTAAGELPVLDACGGHWGRTPESPSVDVYHYHVQDKAPFTVGCYGPNDDGSLVTVDQCRSFYSGCDGDLKEVATSQGTVQYDLWCPCFDAAGSNSGSSIAPLASVPQLLLASVPESSPVVPVLVPAPAPPPPAPAPPPASSGQSHCAKKKWSTNKCKKKCDKKKGKKCHKRCKTHCGSKCACNVERRLTWVDTVLV